MQSNFKLNHSASHLLASAIIKLYPNVRLAIGPAIEEGFYYDFDFETPILESDLPKIEKLMHKIAEQGYEVKKIENYHYDFSNQPYKKELNEQFKKENKNITFYGFVHPKTNENIFTDLCSGNHINNTKEIKYFKLLSTAGAYWRGDSKHKMLTRIHGTCGETQKELDEYLQI